MVMNDFDPAMISAWKELPREPIQLNCFVHLERNVKKRAIAKEFKQRILDNISYLAESTSKEEFQTRWKLTKES